MPTDTQRIQATLYASHLFADLEDAELDKLAGELKLVFPEAGERVIEQGDRADFFYIIYRGSVELLWNNGQEEITFAHQETGDYFGEESLLGKRPYKVSAEVGQATALIEFNRGQIVQITKKYPGVKKTLQMVGRTQELSQKLKFSWLAEDETVYLIARRHWFILLMRLVVPLIFMLIALLFALWGWISQLSLPWMLAGFIALLGLMWGLWNFIDWGNDYYILTDDRIVWLEKVIGLYENRQEAPLHAILSTDILRSVFGQYMSYGDVKVKTFTGLITMSGVGNPQHIVDMILELRQRSQKVQRGQAHEAIHESVRQHIGLDRRPPSPLPKRTWRKQKPKKPRGPLIWQDFIRMRYEDGTTITYRKHWIILFYRTWLPILMTIGVLILIYMHFFSTLINLTLLAIPLLWWLYEYVDWRNDIYQVTDDKIFDINRRPLGTERKQEASLENILSMEARRVGFMGILFNYGKVIIDVSGSRFIFENVYNPAQAQQDIFRRIETYKNKKQENQDKKERERLAEWIEVYDDESNNPYNWNDIGY
jgi:hypothetical protein